MRAYPVHCGDRKLVLLGAAMECMPCGNTSVVLLPEAVVLVVQLNQLFLPETKWPEKLVSKVIIKLSGKSEVVICFTVIFITALSVLWYGLNVVNVPSCL
jgi:hypothetical protein